MRIRKKYIILLLGFFLVGCSHKATLEDAGFQAEQIQIMKEADIEELAISCENKEALKAVLDMNIEKDKIPTYCSISKDVLFYEGLGSFVKANFDVDKIEKYLSTRYYRADNVERYIAFDEHAKDESDAITRVNIGLDMPYYEASKVIEDTNYMGLLVNKYHKLPENYEPKNLVETPSPCMIGSDYSCSTNNPQMVVKEAGEHFSQLVEAATKEGITIKSIASYRDYNYQKNLYDYWYEQRGLEYADAYYARPGQSEHNSGLAIDVTFANENFNEIETSVHYPWLLENMATYGFILRYPEDKEDITGYGYESWHLRYVGKEIAVYIMENHLTLDEYHAQQEMK